MQNEPKKNPSPLENSGIDRRARHNARRYIVQAMYQWQLTEAPLIEIEHEFLRYQITKKNDLEYFKDLLHGIPAHLTELDSAMKPYLVGRPLQEIDAIELAVLRLAIYEILYRKDVPGRVILNEALELTKKFGSVEGYKFVNGILDRVAKEHRALELSQPKPFLKSDE